MPWDRKRLLGYVETIQLIIGETDKFQYEGLSNNDFWMTIQYKVM